TRESGPRIASYLAAGLDCVGVPSSFAGVITTPAGAYLTQQGHFVAGVVISASHNSYQDNGIKVFAHSGFTLADQQEEVLEEGIRRLRGGSVEAQSLRPDSSPAEAYLDHLIACVKEPLNRSLRLSVDCANGAAYNIAPRLFERLGLAAEVTANHPDGRNINLGCGSMHLDFLRSSVHESKADLGVAFDGDADRALFVSAAGKPINGDAVLWMAARYFRVPLIV